MSETAPPDSAMTRGLTPRERSLPRFLLTLAVGIVVFFIVTLVTLVAVALLYVPLFHWPAPTSRAGIVALLGRLAALGASDARTFEPAVQIVGIAVASNVVPFFAFIGVAVLFTGRSLRELCTAAPRFRWRLLAAGFLLACVIVGPFMVLAEHFDPKAGPIPILAVSPAAALRGTYAILCALAFLPAAMGEEILFRGWLLRQLGGVIRSWGPLMLLNGAIFAAAHLDFAPEAFLERWIMGAGFTYMTLRLGGVELSSGVHFANNLIIVLFIQPLTLKPSPNTPIDPSALVGVLALFGSYIAMAEVACRWRSLRDWAGAGLALAPPPFFAKPSV